MTWSDVSWRVSLPALVFAALLLAVLLRAAPAGAEQIVPGQALNQGQVAAVTAAALAFMAPRTLEPVGIPQMAVWGLRGLTTLDPRLTADLATDDAGTAILRLIGPSRVLYQRPAPPVGDAAAWGAAVGQVIRTGWDASDVVRRAGTQTVLRSFFDELFNHLDPYSRYAPPAEAAADRVRRAGRATLGIQPGLSGGAFIVRAVQSDGPAAVAGIRAGDRILAIDGQTVQGADLQAVGALLAGPEGSRAQLTIRGRDGRPRVVEMERVLLPPETVTSARRDDLLVVSIASFARNTAARFAQEVIRGVDAAPPPRAVVVDLRGNRGGVLQQAVATAAMLQPEGVVAITAGRDPEAAHEFRAEGRDLARGLPVVVLVDGRSASAAEILAASLADQRRAVVVGSATLGKGLVQTIAGLPDGGELLVTWSRVLAPRGWPIQGLGVLPQLCTSLGSDATARQIESLAAGVQKLAPALVRHRAARAPVKPGDALDIRAVCPGAEGREDDLAAVRALFAAPGAYAAALMGPAPPPSILGSAQRGPTFTGTGLTGTPPVRN